MRWMSLLLLGLCACATTPFARVKEATSLDDAKRRLDGYQPTVKQYGANAEAWYFDNDDCVLFVDGQVRMTKAAKEKVTYHREEKDGPAPEEDACAPKETKLVK